MLCPVIIRSFWCLCLNLLWSSFSVPIAVRGVFLWNIISVGIDEELSALWWTFANPSNRILMKNHFSHAIPHLESFRWTKSMQISSGDETIANLTKTAQTLLDVSSYPVMPIALTFKHEDNSCSWHILCDTFFLWQLTFGCLFRALPKKGEAVFVLIYDLLGVWHVRKKAKISFGVFKTYSS